ncbi:MAG: hypothetical protein J5850_03235 [Clostridia bacterium]|nr:hypothetical protein [Clostridia bacterium]
MEGDKRTVNIEINRNNVKETLSPLLSGACMEDVNHELYGGIWSQMIFGERFAEPMARPSMGDDFLVSDGEWYSEAIEGKAFVNVLRGGDGPKLLLNDTLSESGRISADIRFDGDGPVGFIIKASDLRRGADSFVGYEISAGENYLLFAKHNRNFEHIKNYPCNVRRGETFNLSVEYSESTIKVYIDNVLVMDYVSEELIKTGSVGFRSWNSDARYCNIRFEDARGARAIVPEIKEQKEKCPRTWTIEAKEGTDFEADASEEVLYFGQKTQLLRVNSPDGLLSISNYGLNHQGLCFEKGRDYEGYLVLSADESTDVTVRLENRSGEIVYGDYSFTACGDFKKYPFRIQSCGRETDGRFSVIIRKNGRINLAYAFLEPGEWGRYKNLHVRADVALEIENTGLTVMRFGGCMANASDWKWKKMIVPYEQRSTYKGWWYNWSSYGFGIIEFMDLCEALGIEYVPDFNAWETPEDMADFVRYATGTDPNDGWVQLRIQNGRKDPYRLKYIQIGNEEVINEKYASNFINIARAVHDVNPDLTLVIGDFDYKEIINDPYDFKGGHVSTLASHKKMLDFCTSIGQKVMIDIHWWSQNGTEPCRFVEAALGFDKALRSICPDSDFKVCVFELNANAHDLERGLCNAYAINAARKYGIFPIISSANALQVDKQNDNGWDQGLIFMNNNTTWVQPPALVAKLASLAYEENALDLSSDTFDEYFDMSAAISADKKTVRVFALNRGEIDIICRFVTDYVPIIEQYLISGALKDANTRENKDMIRIKSFELPPDSTVTLPKSSVNTFILRFE